MNKYGPIKLPRDSKYMMNFPKEQAEYVEDVIQKAKTEGTWSTNQDIKVDVTSLDFWAYWFEKTSNPIVKPMIGTDIDKKLENFRRTHFDFDVSDIEIEREVTFSAAGDLMSTKGLDKSKDKLYENVSDLIFSADITHANLESSLTKEEIKETEVSTTETPVINMTKEQYYAAVSHNGLKYDIVTLANNHILDCGEEGIWTTLEMLDSDNILQVGVNRSEEESKKPQITEIAGLKIGWAAYSWSVNFKPFPKDKPWITNVADLHINEKDKMDMVVEQIRMCRDAGCDLVFAAMHWGLENELYPHPDQLEWARQMAEAGVDAVIGHHPHVPQLYEIIYPEHDKSKAVPVIYSLGNLTPITSSPAGVLSLVLRMNIVQGMKDGKKTTRISNMSLTPVAIVEEKDNGVLRLEKLKNLMDVEKDDEMTGYVERIAYYADIVLGGGWREE